MDEQLTVIIPPCMEATFLDYFGGILPPWVVVQEKLPPFPLTPGGNSASITSMPLYVKENMNDWDIMEILGQSLDGDTHWGLAFCFRNGKRHAIRGPLPIPHDKLAEVLTDAAAKMQSFINHRPKADK